MRFPLIIDLAPAMKRIIFFREIYIKLLIPKRQLSKIFKEQQNLNFKSFRVQRAVSIGKRLYYPNITNKLMDIIRI